MAKLETKKLVRKRMVRRHKRIRALRHGKTLGPKSGMRIR